MSAARAPSVLVIQHVASEGPGRIADALRSRRLAAVVVRVHEGEMVPATSHGHSGIVVMGGPMGVGDAGRLTHLARELRLIEHALGDDVPILGVCLGSQLLATVLGSHVVPGARKEIGWHEVRLAQTAAADALWGGVDGSFTAFHWHGDVFNLPRGGVALASSAMTPVQAFRYGTGAYGLLFHLEVTMPQIREMVRTLRNELDGAGVAPQQIVAGARAHLGRLGAIGGRVFGRWAELVCARAAAGRP